MTQSPPPPKWAKLYKVTEVRRRDESVESERAWHQYTVESEHTKMVGTRFGTALEIREHATSVAEKLNDRLLGKYSSTSQSKKKAARMRRS